MAAVDTHDGDLLSRSLYLYDQNSRLFGARCAVGLAEADSFAVELFNLRLSAFTCG